MLELPGVVLGTSRHEGVGKLYVLVNMFQMLFVIINGISTALRLPSILEVISSNNNNQRYFHSALRLPS